MQVYWKVSVLDGVSIQYLVMQDLQIMQTVVVLRVKIIITKLNSK